jgi:hypothetical protein
MLDLEPKLLLADLLKNRASNPRGYGTCSALRENFFNTYYVNSPLDFDVKWDGHTIESNYAGWINQREPSFENRISFDLDFGWLFFSEEPLMVEQRHPYFHNGVLNDYGVMVAGAFDIGRWFRPIQPSFILWDNVNEFHAKANEPIIYLDFKTDKRIIFKQFYQTQRHMDIAEACANQSFIKKGLSLNQRYDLFSKARLRSVVLKDIKANLMD